MGTQVELKSGEVGYDRSGRFASRRIRSRWDRLRHGLMACFAVALLAATGDVSAHPIHTSVAEADYNAATRTLEVALRIFADDFEAALSTQEKRKVSLARTPADEFETLTRAYLAQHFTVKSPAGTAVPLRWVGRELKESVNELWLFFEALLPDGVEGAAIHHAMLREEFSNQINSVHVRDGSRRTTLVFLPSHREKRVKFRP